VAPLKDTGQTMDDHLKQLLLLGREHYQKRELDKAEYLLKQVVQQTDRFADVFDMLGVIAHAQGDFAQAEQYFEKAVSLNPNYTEAQLNLMVTYNDLGKYDSAREIYARIRGRSGTAGQADPFAMGRIANMHAEISQAYQDAGMPAEAVLELERAVALCPTFADLRTRLATLYRDLGHKDRAREQLEIWGERNGVPVIAQQGGDPAAVMFDAIAAARARGIDVVLADTAGRLPTQLHLMEELKKIRRVLAKAQPGAPHETLLVLDANTGQNALGQVAAFDAALGLTGLILTKLDGTAKGGVVAAIAKALPIPIKLIGIGEGVDDLREFKVAEFVEALVG